jgi:hypothetical protein
MLPGDHSWSLSAGTPPIARNVAQMSEDRISAGEKLIFNGINGATGAYLLPPLSPQELSAIAKGDAQETDHLYNLKLRYLRSTKTKRGVKAGVDAHKLSSAGWGIIFAKADADKIPGIKEALSSLLALRRSQAGALYREFSGEASYQSGENYLSFLARHKIGPGPADPVRVPYYLLIVGDPQTIPFDFQYQLDVQYAVGRIYFETLDQYAQYAQSVVEMETKSKPLLRQATFFGVRNQDDRATQLSATQLVQPLADKISSEQPEHAWTIQSVVGDQATKSTLSDILTGDRLPTLFFSASHGMGFPKDDPRQIPHQGALLCQDWPGPQAWKEPIPEDFYFCADDIPDTVPLAGSIAFLFACYGAGTPKMDDFAQQAFRDPSPIAPHAFLARLPQRLLSQPKGGMQAVIGHVERAWGYSFLWEQSGSQLAVFESALKEIMEGSPVGYAMEYFNERYAELSTVLSSELQGIQFGKIMDDVDLAGKWTANNDARSYVIIGDPAVRLHVEQLGGSKEQAAPITILSARETVVQKVPASPAAAAEAEVAQVWSGGESLVSRSLEILEQLPADASPHQKANLVAGLGDSFAQLQLGGRMENLKAAITEYQTALGLLSPDEKGDNWRQLQIRMGNAYHELYAWTGEARLADRAEQAYSSGISDAIRDENPDQWARVNFNLAQLYALMHKQEASAEVGEKAQKVYQRVLEVITRQSAPFFWALTHYKLASMQVNLLARNEAETLRGEAIENFQAALEVFTSDQFPYQFVEAQIKLGDLFLRESTGARAESSDLAIQAYESTLDLRPIVADVIPESSILIRLGDAYATRIQGDRRKNLFQALAYYKLCLAGLDQDRDQEAIQDLKRKVAQLQADQGARPS